VTGTTSDAPARFAAPTNVTPDALGFQPLRPEPVSDLLVSRGG